MKHDLRGSLAAKCAAVFLLAFTFSGALAGCVIVFFQSYGYGVQDSFTEDPLFLSDVTAAMGMALDKTLEPDSYSEYRLNAYFTGFSALIYDGEPTEENFVGSWSEIPERIFAEYTKVLHDSRAAAGY